MWLELGIPRPDVVGPVPERVWINTDHIVRVDFLEEGNRPSATVVSVKPGGCDRSLFKGDDAERLRIALNKERTWRPLLDFEKSEKKKS